jgi:transcription elongation factor Elf1
LAAINTDISILLTHAEYLPALSEPIDVYCEWVDACEAVAKNESTAAGKSTSDDKGRDDYEDDTRPASKGVLSDSEDGF